MASAGLMAKWSEVERQLERHEHELQLELAHLSEIAQGIGGPRRIVVYSPKQSSQAA